MFAGFAEIKEQLYREIEKFRLRGAVSPERAVRLEELGLSPKFEAFLRRSPKLFGVFIKVGDRYYLSEERLKRIEEQLSLRPLRRWLRHTATVPKGLLRFYVFKLLKERPMSGSEIMEEVSKQTGGQWRPSPGSVYPLLTWLRENGYAEELPREASGIKRYALTEKGERFFKEHANFEEKLQKRMSPMGPLFFLRMGLHADGFETLQEPVSRFFKSLIDLRASLKENLTEQTLKEVKQLLNEASEKIEKLNEKLRKRRK